MTDLLKMDKGKLMKNCLSALLLFFLLLAPPAFGDEELPDPFVLMQETLQSYDSIKDYTAIFVKEQKIRGKLRKPETISMKFRKPFSIYMKWIKRPDKGKEVIYVEGENDGKLVAHLGGLLNVVTPTMKLDPESPLAMGGNLKPITQAGLGNTIDSLMRIFNLAKENNDLKTVYKGKKQFAGREVHVVERILPDKKIYPNTYALIYIDTELKLPVYYASYDKDQNLIERYEYRDLNVDVGLNQLDFNKSNPDYDFGLF